MPEGDDEFYVGYLPQAPRGIARRVGFLVAMILLGAVWIALVLIRGQRPFGPGAFEVGHDRRFSGIVQERPYPALLVPRPGEVGMAPTHSHYPLTSFGKRSASEAVAGLEDRPVVLEGFLIYRDGQTMIQVTEGTVVRADDVPLDRRLVEESLGEMTLVGEIVDIKCFLGTMKPGRLKPHRACAARCISGGVPPILLVEDGRERASYFWLVSREGRPVNREVLDRVAEPVQIRGEVVRRGDLLMLKADPATYRRPGD